MDWVESLNKAIDYIEENLTCSLTYEKIAKNIYISSYHFQRTFKLLTGLTVGEYIRNRRLSLAGQELNSTNSKVIDAALKYGYETPESFTKAFERFHGITPNQAKVKGSNLKSFNRLIIKIKLEGGTVMEYKIADKDEFKVLAKTKLFNMETSYREIPKFWNDYFSSGYAGKVRGDFGICEEAKGNCKEFHYGIGCEYKDGSKVPEGFEIIKVPAHTWAMFKCVGPMPDAIQTMWKRIYSEWLPQAEYELVSGYDMEIYADDDNKSKDYVSEIWIPVKKK